VYLPQVGDIYVEYEDNRNDQWALTNGFPTEVIWIHKVTAIRAGVAYCAVLNMPITDTGEYPFPYNELGPVSNFIKFPQYRTLVKPDPN
jgi:hypothetical protein